MIIHLRPQWKTLRKSGSLAHNLTVEILEN